ncbi:MAG TPA: class I SAM-dependent methyltransferase [Solirubrobacteraceae bacterium]|nr:class I SAM-dependent methyltransferase [Solirubrobacteraceae bacterium]
MSSYLEDTAWFEELYADAEAGRREVPWDRGGPNPFLEQWARERDVRGDGRSALVIGTALGDDAEMLAARGFAVTAFDVAPTAIERARRRFPSSSVDYRVADLLALPEDLRGAFDLVAECITVQALPVSLRDRAIDAIASTVAPGGTLVVVSGIHEGSGPRDGPPWPLTRAELDRFELSLRPVSVSVARIGDAVRWRGEYIRPGE